MTDNDLTLAERAEEKLDRARLEERADIVRWKLLRTIDALDRKRHDALHVGKKLRRHWLSVSAVGALTVGAMVASAALWIGSEPMRARRKRHERWSMVGRVWRHPADILRARESVFTSSFRHVASSILTALLLRAAKRALKLERPPALRELPRH